MHSVREQGGRVYVHCVQGISRSATLIIAYLIYYEKMNYKKALELVQARREVANPNFSFLS
jgi:protein-tyrosine phosphatase